MSSTPAPDRAQPRLVTRPRVTAAVLLLAIGLGWWFLFRPSSIGGPLTLVMVTGASMEPGLHTDDLAFVYERDSYEVGDVVAFRAEAVPDKPGAFVIHRIKGGGATAGFTMRGGNNDWDDPWSPTADKVTGEMLFSLPGAGTAVRWLAQPIHLGAILAGLTASLTMAGGRRESEPTTEAVQPAQPAPRKEPVPA